MKVPIGNTHELEEFGPSPGRTDFQTEYSREIATRPGFDFFCLNPACDEPYRGPFMLSYYTKDGKLHGDWVGQRCVLRQSAI